jgi:2-C-methyl-D-erythritol 2,4-cyclodiphosphate synthase
MMRIGHGYDVHAFGDGDHVVLGGVRIDFDRGLVAHSDGDVMIHALCDALLGAAGLGDIGKHFPDTDERLSGADSRDLLRAVVSQLDAAGWSVGNVDLTVIAQSPRLSEHVSAMQMNLAHDLGVAQDCVNVKATTTERLGFVGREEGIASHAVALLTSQGLPA